MGSFRNPRRPGVRETKARVRPEQSSDGAPRVPEALDPLDALAADVGPLDAELLGTALEFEAVDLELPPEPTLLDIPEPLDLRALDTEVNLAQWEADGLAALEALHANTDPLVSADDALDLARLLQERMEAQGCLRGGSVVACAEVRKPKRRGRRRTDRGAP